jgi:molybdate transport system regulatory protein
VVTTTRKRQTRIVKPRVKLWLEANGESVLCRGLCDMLRAVDETGSIKEAAAQVQRSYRFVWSRIKEAESAFHATLVETRVGGHGAQRSELTPLAHDLLRDFEGLCQQIYHLVDEVFGEQLKTTLRRHGHKT